jgi:hypothetical protein
MQGAIGLGAKASGLEFALLTTTWILNQMIAMVFAQGRKALHACHSTHISIAANQVYTWVYYIQLTKMTGAVCYILY